jgi:hypothetical protein
MPRKSNDPKATAEPRGRTIEVGDSENYSTARQYSTLMTGLAMCCKKFRRAKRVGQARGSMSHEVFFKRLPRWIENKNRAGAMMPRAL